jgi:hypothetical protein
LYLEFHMFDPLVYSSSPAAGRALRDFCALPFDLVRAQYASAARHRLIRPSMLAWRDFERSVAALERLSLGPLARSN